MVSRVNSVSGITSNSYKDKKAQKSPDSTVFESKKDTKTDLSNDGKFSLSEAAKNFAKGLVSPITGMFSSWKNFALGVGMIAGSALLIAATGGAAAPVLVAAGVAMGAVQAGSAAVKIATAKNGDDIEKAFYDVGGATSTIGLSVLGAKGALKQANVETEGIKAFGAVKKCFTSSKDLAKESFDVFKSGHYKNNLKSYITISKQPKMFRQLAKETFEYDKANFETSYNSFKELLPNEFKPYLTGRVKSEVSRYARMVRERRLAEPEVRKRMEYDSELIKSKIEDGCGLRLNLRDITPEAMDRFVSFLAQNVKNGKIKLTEIENYRGFNPKYKGKNAYYLSKEQIETLVNASENREVKIRLKDDGIKTNRNADKPSGYTAAQLKIQTADGVRMELQIRGREVDKVAEWEHIPYDLSHKKDISRGNNQIGILLSDVSKTVKKLKENKSEQKLYSKYIYDNYIYAQAKELGKIRKKPDLPEGINPVLSAENLQLLSQKMSAYKSGNLKNPFDITAQLPVTAGVESLSSND